jgi:hypothetical protein
MALTGGQLSSKRRQRGADGSWHAVEGEHDIFDALILSTWVFSFCPLRPSMFVVDPF